MAFKMRTTRPEAGNKYYITKSKGGYSNAIQGSPTDKNCNVLSNCVGYAVGRFNEIGGYGSCKYLKPVNAEKFMQYKGTLKTGQTPKLGACMVWQGGKTLKGSDGAGHVAIVEKVVSNTEVYTSESGWGDSRVFWNQTRKKSGGNWGMGSSYKFLGFIYNPAVSDEEETKTTATTITNTKMKYNAANKPLVCMQTQSTCYKGTKPMTVKGVLWHSTGANNPNLKRYVQPSDDAADKAEMLKILGTNTYKNDWNHITRYAGLNCWIGKLADGTVSTVQTMPWNYRPWGCGSGKKGSCNDGWIQFEACEDSLNDKSYFEKVYKEACEITAYLCKMYNIDPEGTVELNGVKVPTILCHADSYKLGLGNNHGDVYNWFNKYGKTMDDVRTDVAAIIKNSGNTVVSADSSIATTYRVRVTANVLNVRNGAGTNYKLTGQIRDGGVYTIIEEKTGTDGNRWGLLKSRLGWICLNYTTKLNS